MGGRNQRRMTWEGFLPGVGMRSDDAEKVRRSLDDRVPTCTICWGMLPLAPLRLYYAFKGQTASR